MLSVSAGENVLTPCYANPGVGHGSMPARSCNADGTENFAGAEIGPDNDGDGNCDGNDTNCSTSGVDDAPGAGALQVRNFPNPFNPMTVIRHELPAAGWAQVRIHAATGELVRTVVARDHDCAKAFGRAAMYL